MTVFVPSVTERVPVFPIVIVGEVSTKAKSVSQPEPVDKAVSVPAPAVILPILRAYSVIPDPAVAAEYLIPLYVQAPPVQAVKVGAARLIELNSLVPVAPEVLSVVETLMALTTLLPVVLAAAFVKARLTKLPVALAAGAY